VVRLYALIRQLESPDDQVMLLYLEDMDAAAIGEVTGLSANAVAIRIHRIKLLLARKFA
jgi:RNA polymerase sigma-70 factor (ECF subfamily)